MNTRMRIFLTGVVALAALISAGCNEETAHNPNQLNLGPLGAYAETGVYEQYKAQGFYIVHLPEDKIVALDVASTHLGCMTTWLQDQGSFRAACDGSLYDMDGINRAGPAPRPLERYKIIVHGNDLVVDKRVKFRAELGEWTSPESWAAWPHPSTVENHP